MVKWGETRHWYFITQRDMGDTMSLTPRTPILKNDDEPDTHRICVAPTAAHCMSALNLDAGNLHVYRTRRKVKARVPYGVYDSHITKEHWLVSKTRFTRVETLKIHHRSENSRDLKWLDLGWDDKMQKKQLIAIRSYCKRRDPRLGVIKHANQVWRNRRSVEQTELEKTHNGRIVRI